MPRWPRALVTGASGGIGEAFARRLAADGSNLVLVARSTKALKALAAELGDAHGIEVEVLSADLTTEDGVASVAERLREHTRPVDLLVNNAGYGRKGLFHQLADDDQDAMLRLNIRALVELSHAALEVLTMRSGGILNVSSLGALAPTPTMAVYSATKSFVSSFTEALHEELLPTGVHVTCLEPGFTRTGFQAEADFAESAMPGFLWMEADQVARSGLKGVAANRTIVSPGLNAAASPIARLLPSVVLRKGAGLALKDRA